MEFLQYPPCSGVAEVASVTWLSDPVFASSSSPSPLVAQVASGRCFAASLVEFCLGGCFATSTSFGRMLCRYGLNWSGLFGGCFATSLGLGRCFAAVVLLHLGGCFAAGDPNAATEAVQP